MQTTSIGWIVKKGKNMSNSGAKFKVGDKVKIINASGGGVLGEIKLTVKSVHDHTAFSCGWFYNFIEGSGLYENRLELVQEEFKEGRSVNANPDFRYNKKENYIKTDTVECEAEVKGLQQ